MKRLRPYLLLLSMSCLIRQGEAVSFSAPVLLDGVDANGNVINAPSGWNSATMGAWNAKGARYNPATHRLVFESKRGDLLAGSITSGAIQASIELPPEPGTLTKVTSYFVAGPGAGTANPSSTTVLYVARRDGSNPVCIGCSDVQDGVGGVKIYKVLPSAGTTPNSVAEQTGAFVYANQNKDLAAWYPNGQWVIASVEMPIHAINHSVGNSEIGMFNDLWAISGDGKIWVQLTDFASTWGSHQDPVAHMAYECYDTVNCALRCQYSHVTTAAFESYACTDNGVAPPAEGLMRSTVGNQADGPHGGVPIVWAERVGIDFRYAFAGPQHLATAELVIAQGVPALIAYQRNLTPTTAAPSGVDQWFNPGNDTAIGTGYEPFSYSSDDQSITFASDIFAQTSGPQPASISRASLYFTDAVSWRWNDAAPTVSDISKYDGTIFPYQPNQVNGWGHWEDAAVYGIGRNSSNVVAFNSSADMNPAWDPTNNTTSDATFGLDTWVVPADRSAPAVRVTSFNTSSPNKYFAYPTASDPADNGFFLTVVVTPAVAGSDPPGMLYKISQGFGSTGTDLQPGDLSLVRAYPNPWRSDLHSAIDVTFDQLAPGSTIKIFDLSGHWVRTLTPSGVSITWDRRNDHGDVVASGLYVYVVTDAAGQRTRGKLTLIK